MSILLIIFLNSEYYQYMYYIEIKYKLVGTLISYAGLMLIRLFRLKLGTRIYFYKYLYCQVVFQLNEKFLLYSKCHFSESNKDLVFDFFWLLLLFNLLPIEYKTLIQLQ